MPPRLATIAAIQQAISTLLLTHEPEFLRFGYSMFVAFAAILIAWQGVQMMFARDGLGDQMFAFARLMLFISFGYSMIAFYEAPIPGIGISFSNLITDQAHAFANILDARSLENVFAHLDELVPGLAPLLRPEDMERRLQRGWRPRRVPTVMPHEWPLGRGLQLDDGLHHRERRRIRRRFGATGFAHHPFDFRE